MMKDFLEMDAYGSSDSGDDTIGKSKKRTTNIDLDDDDDFDEETPMLTVKEKKKKLNWNIFNTRPWDNYREHDDLVVKKWLKVFKTTTYIVVFLSMTIFLFLSKVTLLIASTNIRAYPQSYQNLDSVSTFSRSVKELEFGGNYPDNSRPTLQCYNYTFYYPEFYNDTDNGMIHRNVTWPGTFCMLMPYHFNVTRFNSKNMTCTNLDRFHPRYSDSDNGKKFNNSEINVKFSAVPCISVHFRWMWAVFLMICIPYVVIFFRCLWKVLFKTVKSPSNQAVIIVMIVDGLHTAGLSYILFYILPGLNDAIQGLMLLTGVGFVPACLAVINKPSGLVENSNTSLGGIKMTLVVIVNIIAAGVQLSVGAIMTWKSYFSPESDKAIYCLIVPCLFCVSLRYWENYNGDSTSSFSSIPILARLASEMKKSRIKLQLISSTFRILVTFGTLIGCAYLLLGKISPGDRHDWFNVLWMQGISCSNRSVPGINSTLYEIDSGIFNDNWISMWTLNMFCGFFIYFMASVSAKMQIQRLATAIPLMISTPIVAGLMIAGCQIWNDNPCNMSSSLFNVTYFYRCYGYETMNAWPPSDEIKEIYLFPFWWISLLWVTRHILFPKSERLAKIDKIFVLPMFDGTLIGESILLNRNRNDKAPPSHERGKPPKKSIAPAITDSYNKAEKGEGSTALTPQPSDDFLKVEEIRQLLTTDSTPMVYICATMWHENETEMIQMLKSIFRLDKHQASLTNAYYYDSTINLNYYNFEAHIFFDNSMNTHDDEYEEYTVNDYVHLLVKMLKDAAFGEHGIPFSVDDPTKYPTPYGGRLEWKLPGENKLIVHLKDNAKIRNKKRWSQVMYMYYFLGFKLCCSPDLTEDQKITRSKNTYLLALDGDVDFQPIALTLLIDLMRRQDKVGAVCGRIHPIGSGPMVWYQEFEYAIGHWLQKAAEHVMGCVLCSPGCFSLFRGSAIMDENVMRTYTKLPTEARHHVQYDQGEDRWLCTLLLQQGYRVEYCAASDSFTFCPESFSEFFNQRRRWMPSTMSNILDLLESYKHTTRVNENISFIYIIYQGSILLTSLLSPGIIYLMIVGATEQAIRNFVQMNFGLLAFLNALPLFIFVVLCFKASSEIQLAYAKLLGGIYIIVQLIVLIGTCVTMYRNNWCYSTTMFFLGLSLIFIVAGFLHPQEFHCLPKGFLYYISIPTMYMLLMIYATLNLHVVSWGTREVKKSAKEMEEEEKRLEAALVKKKEQEAKQKGVVFDVMEQLRKRVQVIKPSKDYCNCTRTLCNIICCSKPDHPPNEKILQELIKRVETLENINTENVFHDTYVNPSRHNNKIVDRSKGSMSQLAQESAQEDNTSRKTINRRNSVVTENEEPDYDLESVPDYDGESSFYEGRELRDELVNPSWIEDKNLGNGPKAFLPQEETKFFQELITTYLYPLIKDKESEKKSADELIELRNKVASGFIFANITFAIVTIVAQANSKDVYIPWPCPAKDHDGQENLAKLDDHFSKVDLSGIIFLIVFGTCIFVQFIAMFIHRLGTFMHLMSTTELFKKGDEDKVNQDDITNLMMALGNLEQDDDDDENEDNDIDYDDDDNDDGYSGSDNSNPKKTGLQKIIREQKREQVKTYNEAVIKRLKQLAALKDGQLPNDKGFKAATKNAMTMKALMTVRRNMDTLKYRRNQENYNFDKMPVRNSPHPKGPYEPPVGRGSMADEQPKKVQGRFVQNKNFVKNRLQDYSVSSRSSNVSDHQFPY